MSHCLQILVRGKIWKYPGKGGWCFVSLGDGDSKSLKDEKRIGRTAYGFVPVTATLGSSVWKTTLFPSKDGPYLLAIKGEVRAKAQVGVGDEVEVSCVIALQRELDTFP
ncbi:DUF1905 domain-containing protein [Methylosinus sp. Sm6]|uniref:DUF1905 domain-containing protein n=1 Tax=Methylosinus sp. Sm6 TaxID=2866948 RepID=UPI001C9906C4|nr:DUF1905 domain-containing protein [Methylosinus sp. Sm6]MBY6241450.1 DUF1905 domain-containing protein [Methylosinus sp. Sm6]